MKDRALSFRSCAFDLLQLQLCIRVTELNWELPESYEASKRVGTNCQDFRISQHANQASQKY